jgi:hypothetical protein
MQFMNERCDGLARRDALRLGIVSAFGLSLFGRSSTFASTDVRKKAKSCILLWLDGGPSHLETFDVKPDAPAEVRGPFQPIATNVTGTYISELLKRTAKVTDKIAIIRSMTSPLGEHGIANQYMLSGYKPSPVIDYPSYGSVLSKVRGGQNVLPPYIAIPSVRGPAGAGFLGTGFDPFSIGGDPSKANFRVKDLDFYPGVDSERMNRRRAFVDQLEKFQRHQEEGNADPDPRFEQAYRMVTSEKTKRAFDLSLEKEDIRSKYGLGSFGQSCLMARRLVENGVPFVTVDYNGWDTHESLVLRLKEGFAGAKVGVGLVPTFDQGFATLVEDLDERGMLDETLVIAMGEFGRTPKINTRGGRDHWPRVFSIALAGGGVRGGVVVGKSDAIGESPAERPVSPSDLAYTIYSLLGVEPSQELQTEDGRPVQINQGGELIKELLS